MALHEYQNSLSKCSSLCFSRRTWSVCEEGELGTAKMIFYFFFNFGATEAIEAQAVRKSAVLEPCVVSLGLNMMLVPGQRCRAGV